MRGNHKRFLQLLTIAGAMFAAWMALAAPAGVAKPSRMRVGMATRLPKTARFTSALASQRPLRLTIALKPRNAAALQSFASAVSTPGTAQYHRYLTVSQFARRFGATSATIAKVSRALRAEGLRVSAPTANDLTLSVSGTARAAERAFAVSESHVRLANGRIAYTNRQAPTLPADIAGDVQGVIGLDSVVREAPMSLVRDTKPAHHLQAADRHAHVATGGPVPSCAGALSHQAPNGTGAASGTPRIRSPRPTSSRTSIWEATRGPARFSGWSSFTPLIRRMSRRIRAATGPAHP